MARVKQTARKSTCGAPLPQRSTKEKVEKKEVPYLNGKIEVEVDSEAKERIEYSNLTVFPPLPSSLSPLFFPLENNINNNNNNINHELRSKSEEVKEEEISFNESSEISEINNNNKDNNKKVDNNDNKVNEDDDSGDKDENKIVKLPMEILHIIIEKCSGKDLLAISQVNKQLNQIAKEINEKYQALYLSSYFPMNKSKKQKFIKLTRFPHMYSDDEDDSNNNNNNNNINTNNLNNNNNNLNNIIKMRVTRKLPNSKINHKPNYASKLNRFSYFDPYYDHFYFWKDLFQLRSLLENHQSNPCDWINDNIETVDIQSIEFFRIHSTIIKSNNGLQFNEVELVGITANLRPLRFLVRHGDHPLLFSSLMEQRNEFHQKEISFRLDPNHVTNNNNNNNNNDNEEVGIKRKFEEEGVASSTGRGKFGIKRFKNSVQEEINNNNNNNNNNNEQTNESIGKSKEKTNINTIDPYDSGSENDHLFAEVKDERMETHYCYHSRFPHCPCNLQDQIPYETYLWNFKKEKYSMLSRTAICRGCDECTIFRSNIANQLDKIIFVDNDFREKNEEKYQNWWKKGDIENVCLAAFAASTQNFGDYSCIKSN